MVAAHFPFAPLSLVPKRPMSSAPEDVVVRLESRDGEVFELPAVVARKSGFIKDILEQGSEESTEVIPIASLNGRELAWVRVCWLLHVPALRNRAHRHRCLVHFWPCRLCSS